MLAVTGAGALVLARLGVGAAQSAQATSPHGQPQTHDAGAAGQSGGADAQAGTTAEQGANPGPAANPGNPGNQSNPGNQGNPGGQPPKKGPNSPNAVCCLPPPLPQGLPKPGFPPKPKPTPGSPNSIPVHFP